MFDSHLEAWFSGIPRNGVDRDELVLVTTAPTEATLAVEQSLLCGDPASAGYVISDRSTFPRAVRVLRGVDGVPQTCDEFTGRIAPGEDLQFGDGLQVRIRHYGVADFEPLDGPTVLTITDDADFSAYLRDADVAWQAGGFASYTTHPAAVIANLSSLGGAANFAGPIRRLYVEADDVARTSPVGRGLGALDEGVAQLQSRWERANAAGVWADGASIEDAVPDQDRSPALSERPWLSRYVAVLQSIRALRASGREARRVSGFGGRLSPGLIDAAGAAVAVASGIPATSAGSATSATHGDPVNAPVLAQFGAIYRAIDPQGNAHADITAAQLRVLETVLMGARVTETRDEIVETCQWLLAHGVAREWCAAMRSELALASV